MGDLLKFPTAGEHTEAVLDCGHTVMFDAELKFPYDGTEHYIRCPTCRHSLERSLEELDPYRIPTAWQKVISHERLPNVHGGLPYVLPAGIMRLLPQGRVEGRVFPYIPIRVRRGI